jgi:biotin transport system substrate-specific component
MSLVEAISPRSESAQLARAIRVASVLFVAALTAAAAQVSIPLWFTAVPFTFQPIVVLLGALALGPRLGFASQVVYLAAGMAGAPVFAASAALAPGIGRLLGPTGGYLMTYPLAAWLTGSLAARGFDRRYATSVVAMIAGLAVVFAGGVAWLSAQVGWKAALVAGFYPFIVADIVKVAAAAGIVPAVWNLIGRQR